jgi:hypothetical protein
MTVSELYKSVAQLGFEDSLENDTRFLLAANRALLQVNSLRPATESYTLLHYPPQNLLYVDHLNYKVNPPKTCTFAAKNAKSCYFELYGKGSLTIKAEKIVKEIVDGKETTRIEWDVLDNGEVFFDSLQVSPQKHFLRKDNRFLDYSVYTGNIYFEFDGDYTCHLMNVAFYAEVTSENVNDIVPNTEVISYDLSKLIPNLISVASPPYYIEDGETVPLRDFEIADGHILRIPRVASDAYIIRYDRRLRPISAPSTGGLDTSTERVDIADDLAVLLPDLIAAYVWLDDEPEKAQYYLSLYQLNAATLESRKKTFDDAPFVSTNGW